MRLTLQIKLLPDNDQSSALLKTIKEANAICNKISKIAFEKKCFNQYKLHHVSYYEVKKACNFSSQMIIRCIGKVTDSYKLDRKIERTFKETGGIAYDPRILTYKQNSISIWTTSGRLKIPFICHRHDWLPFIKGEADLITKKGKFFLLQSVEIPEEPIKDIEEFLGVDFGVKDIISLSTGENVSSEWINKHRLKREKIRRSIQRKGTRSSHRLLKRLSGRERSAATLINHTLSKRIVEKAKCESKGIAIENLKGIRKAANKLRKEQRGLRHKWSFHQLRGFIEYKARKAGVPVAIVNPAYTSQLCSKCGKMGIRKGKVFSCKTCGNMDSDINAAINIAIRGRAVNHAEKSISGHKRSDQV